MNEDTFEIFQESDLSLDETEALPDFTDGIGFDNDEALKYGRIHKSMI
jgi:hypothetical protein